MEHQKSAQKSAHRNLRKKSAQKSAHKSVHHNERKNCIKNRCEDSVSLEDESQKKTSKKSAPNLCKTPAPTITNNRRRTNVQQLTCKIDLSNSFYYFFFSFVLLELKPFVLKGKVLGEKFWKSAKKCEKVWKSVKNYETILPFSCCPLVFPWNKGVSERDEQP